MNLEIRSDITCNFCQQPVLDFRDAHVFWKRRDREHGGMIAVAHSGCDTVDVKKYYASWAYLSRLVERQEEIRRYFNVGILDNEFIRQEVKDGLEQIFRSVPEEYFHFTENDYVGFNESSRPDDVGTRS